ncbi:hypothetical protein B0G82_4112 [Paraburkholderia sp. BL17N1]|nr:hypothetical protein B0G82_4112 [Paraburkholderia sp. BL17N1]
MSCANALHLSFDDHVHNFDASRQDQDASNRLESQHGPDAPLDRPMILLERDRDYKPSSAFIMLK